MKNSGLYTQGEVAKLFGVTKDSVFEWEREGLLKLHSIHQKTHVRLYSSSNVEDLLKHKEPGEKITKCTSSLCGKVLGLDKKDPPIVIIVTYSPQGDICNHDKRDNTFCYTCKSLIFKRVLCEDCAAKMQKQLGKPLLIAEDPPHKHRPTDWRAVSHSYGFSDNSKEINTQHWEKWESEYNE